MASRTSTLDAVIADGGTDSAAIDVREISYGMFQVPAAIDTSTAVVFKACETNDGTYASVYDSSNSAISITFTVSTWYKFPADVIQGGGFIKICVADAQSGAKTFPVQLKSDPR